jgi:Tol biopolymer transport system component
MAGRRGIWVVEAAGGRSRQVVDHPSFNRVPSWSRDGRFLYFSSNRTGSDEIFRVPISGGEVTQVTDRGGYVALESADGSTLFYTKIGGSPSHLFSRALAGGAERQVMNDLVFSRAFDLRPDGVYYITRAADNEFFVKVFEFSSSKTRVITPLHGEPELGLSVSPDGKRIVYTLFEEGEADLMLVENFR